MVDEVVVEVVAEEAVEDGRLSVRVVHESGRSQPRVQYAEKLLLCIKKKSSSVKDFLR